MNLEEVVNLLARDLPDGYEVELTVERGSASVQWHAYTSQKCWIEAPDDTLPDQVMMALRAATEHAEQCTREGAPALETLCVSMTTTATP